MSSLSLGSWRTYERLPAETGVAILRAARDEGINFFDDARYDDETGTAPMRTGYSEVLFGELFRGAGLRRDEAVVTNKLWWEFWPEQSAAAELDASLQRMRFDHVDVIYANAPPPGMAVADLVAATAGLVASGKARAWGLVNWPADLAVQAVEAASGLGVTPPCAVQLPYSLVQRSWVEDPVMTRALETSGAGLIASFCLAGGVLTGKYLAGPAAGRAAGTLDEPRVAPAVAAAGELAAPGRPAGYHRGRAGPGLPVHPPGPGQRAVRRHQPGAAPGQLRRDRPAGTGSARPTSRSCSASGGPPALGPADPGSRDRWPVQRRARERGRRCRQGRLEHRPAAPRVHQVHSHDRQVVGPGREHRDPDAR